MADQDLHQQDLHERVRAALASLELVDGRPRMSPDALLMHAAALGSVPPGERDRVAEELLAFATRAWKTDEDAWDDALLQICILVGVVVGSLEAVGDSLGDVVGRDKARALIGAAASAIPVGTGSPPEGALSPLAALLKHRTEKK